MTKDQAVSIVKTHLKNKGDVKHVEITEKMVLYWWRMLNFAVFKGKLHKPAKIKLVKHREEWAWIGPYGQHNQIELSIHPIFKTKRLFLAVLIHEMVHAWEHQTHNCMGHGKRFYAWQNRVKRHTGLNLTEVIKETDYYDEIGCQ